MIICLTYIKYAKYKTTAQYESCTMLICNNIHSRSRNIYLTNSTWILYQILEVEIVSLLLNVICVGCKYGQYTFLNRLQKVGIKIKSG